MDAHGKLGEADYFSSFSSFSSSRSKQEDSHDTWPDDDFANSFQDFSRTKKSYS